MKDEAKTCPAVELGFVPSCPGECGRVLWGQACPKKREGHQTKTAPADQ